MHITVTRQEFASAFTWAYGGLPKYPGLPVLSGMRLMVGDCTLTLAVFDYEQSRRVRLPGENASAGQILVSGPDLKKIISSLPAGKRVEVDISADGPALTLAVQGITWTLPSLPDEDYPELPELPPLAGVADGEDFAQAIGRVCRAAAREGDKYPVHTCINVETRSAALALAATDRARLALDRVFWTPAVPGAASIRANVPARPAEAFAKQAGKSGKVAIHLADGLAGFRDDSRELTIRTVTGDFPGYKHLLRSESPVTLTADAHALAGVVERMSKVSDKTAAGWTLVALAYAAGTLTVQALAAGNEIRASETLPASAEGTSEFTVRFNAPYLSSMLEGLDGTAVIGLRPAQPATISAPGTATFRALVVPVTEDGQ